MFPVFCRQATEKDGEFAAGESLAEPGQAACGEVIIQINYIFHGEVTEWPKLTTGESACGGVYA